MAFSLFNSFLHPSLWIKIVTLIAIVFYVVFTFVVFTQIKVMTQILSIPNAKTPLRILSLIHIIFGIMLFLLAIAIL